MKNFKLLFLTLCLGLISPAGMNSLYAQCPTGTDIHIANDISGSVDSREFQQSKDFVSLLGANFGTAYGTGNTETRVSISNWSAGSGRFVEYNFPSAGQNYATSIGDILSYTTSARPFRGGTAAKEVEPGIKALHMGNANYTDNVIKFTGVDNDKAKLSINLSTAVNHLNTFVEQLP